MVLLKSKSDLVSSLAELQSRVYRAGDGSPASHLCFWLSSGIFLFSCTHKASCGLRQGHVFCQGTQDGGEVLLSTSILWIFFFFLNVETESGKFSVLLVLGGLWRGVLKIWKFHFLTICLTFFSVLCDPWNLLIFIFIFEFWILLVIISVLHIKFWFSVGEVNPACLYATLLQLEVIFYFFGCSHLLLWTFLSELLLLYLLGFGMMCFHSYLSQRIFKFLHWHIGYLGACCVTSVYL